MFFQVQTHVQTARESPNLNMDILRYWFQFTLSAAYVLCLIKLPYNKTYKAADFKESCIF